MFKNVRAVERTLFGRGSFNQLDDVLAKRRTSHSDSFVVFLLDSYFDGKALHSRVPVRGKDLLLLVDVSQHEPTTQQVDDLVKQIRQYSPGRQPDGIIGIGGGSVMDIAKAVSLMLTNTGKSQEYQGFELIKNPAIYHMGIPTIAGTGAEVSRTAVLTGPTQKLGLNSDYTYFDQILLDPELIFDVPKLQWFYTGMDCYIHCVESMDGTLNNGFSRAYGYQSLDLCREVYLNPNIDKADADEKLMVASVFGGLSLTYSQVGICHGLSYGLSYVFDYRHGYANCVAMNILQDYYPQGVDEFHRMMDLHQITLPSGLAQGWSEAEINEMADVAIKLEHFWVHAFGPDWKKVFNRDTIIGLYQRM